jgi:hypothetical protein
MAKKIEKSAEQKADQTIDSKLDELFAMMKAQEETNDNFRTSFKNLEFLIANLKERNRLR